MELKSNQVIRKILKNGNIVTIAGKSGVMDYTGDGGPASNATLNNPRDLALAPNAKSYWIPSLSSEVYISNRKCDLDIVEYFEYDFVGSYARIGRALPAVVDKAYSISTVSNNGFAINAEFLKIDNDPYIVMYLNPSTAESETTRISFKLSYSLSYFSRPFLKYIYDNETANYFSIYYTYKDNSNITNLTCTFIFSPEISFTKPLYGYQTNQTTSNSVKFIQNFTKQFSPSINFYPSDTSPFDKCSTIIDLRKNPQTPNSDSTIIIVATVVPTLMLIAFSFLALVFFSMKYPNHRISKGFNKVILCCCGCCNGSGGGGDGNDDSRGSTGYTSFNDNSYSNSNDNSGSGGGGGGGGGDYYTSGGGGSGFAD